MRDTATYIHTMADSKPIISGIVGTIAGWGTAWIGYLNAANIVLTFVGTFFGTIAAVYTALLVIHKFHTRNKTKNLE